MNRLRTQTATNQIPEELLRSIPRHCRLTALGKFALAGAVVLMVGAVGFSIGAYLSAARTKALKQEMAQHGQLASGVVTKTYRTGDDDKRDVFVYEFSVENKMYTGRTEVGVRHSPHYQAGSSVPVRYLQAQPEKSWIDGYPPGGVPLFVIPLVAGGLLCGGYAVFRNLRRQEELVSEGRAVLAKVVRVKKVRRGGAHGSHRVHRAEIQFSLLSGARQNGHIDFGKNPPPPESAIVVVYDRENPRRILRYPACLVRVEQPGEW